MVEVHDFDLCCGEVVCELFACVVVGVDFGECAQFGVRAEHEVGVCVGPVQVVGCVVVFEFVVGC